LAHRKRWHNNRIIIIIVRPMASVALDFWDVITSELRHVYENMDIFLILTTQKEQRRCHY
jgi:hypothetical protein